jgi:Flp pilus assembly protein TadG
MIGFLQRFIADLRSDSRGVSLIEFAVIAPVLGLMTVGIADLTRAVSERMVLESAAHRAMERAALGTTNASTSDYSFLREEAATAAGVPLANVTYDSWVECDGTRQPNYTDECTATQQVARYVHIEITKAFVPNFKWTGASFNISGDAAMRIQ